MWDQNDFLAYGANYIIRHIVMNKINLSNNFMICVLEI